MYYVNIKKYTGHSGCGCPTYFFCMYFLPGLILHHNSKASYDRNTEQPLFCLSLPSLLVLWTINNSLIFKFITDSIRNTLKVAIQCLDNVFRRSSCCLKLMMTLVVVTALRCLNDFENYHQQTVFQLFVHLCPRTWLFWRTSILLLLHTDAKWKIESIWTWCAGGKMMFIHSNETQLMFWLFLIMKEDITRDPVEVKRIKTLGP